MNNRYYIMSLARIILLGPFYYLAFLLAAVFVASLIKNFDFKQGVVFYVVVAAACIIGHFIFYARTILSLIKEWTAQQT